MKTKRTIILQKAVREIIVRRKSLEKLAVLPLMEKYRNQAATDLMKFATRFNLAYALTTKKF